VTSVKGPRSEPTFVDTSALFALLDRRDDRHEACAEEWRTLLDSQALLVTTNYTLLESCAIVQRRLGLDALRTLINDFVPLLTVEWIDHEVHAAALSALLTASRRELSLVDCTSFEVMRRLDVTQVLTTDTDFTGQGFTVLPG